MDFTRQFLEISWVLRVRPDFAGPEYSGSLRQLTPVLPDHLIQTELLEPVTDLPEGKA